MHPFSHCSLLCWAFCCLLPAAAQETVGYLDTAQGWHPYTMGPSDTPASLSRGMKAEQQQARRRAGVSTPAELRHHNRRATDPDTFFPAAPPTMQPYLDSLFIPGNTCAEPCAFITGDPISTGAQKLKTALSEIGFEYNSTWSYNAARLSPSKGRQAAYSSFNNNIESKWFLVKDARNRHALFLSCEADWGEGTNFDERYEGVQTTLGSLSNPQGCLRGGRGVFIPELALGASLCEGRYVVMAGSLDTSNYLDQNAYSADWNGNLINQSFNYNPCLPLLWSNWGLLTAWQPCESFYTLYATTGSNTSVNQNPLTRMSRNYWVHIGEIGFVRRDVAGMGPGTYRLQYTSTHNDGNTGNGFAANVQQQLGAKSQLGFFTRCGVNDSDAAQITGTKAAVTGGVVLIPPFSSAGWGSKANNDQLALGFLWQRRANSTEGSRHAECGLELSAVVQLTPTFFLQPDVQYIHHPAHNEGRGGAWVWQLQTVFRF